MTELERVDWLRRRFPHVRGIGDDCAVIPTPARGEEWLFTTDMMVEGVHFRREHPAFSIGHRTLARGLSDIAAMGGVPKFCLLSMAVAPWAGERWIDRFYEGLFKLAERHRLYLAGGDLSAADRTMCDIVVCGAVPRGQALRRSGARVGDGIYVSGALGGAASRNYPPARFEPKIRLGQKLRGIATSAMDLSDGLSIDLYRLCKASNVGALLDGIPVATGATLDDALHGGDDYELLFTLPHGVEAGQWGHRVGVVTDGPAGTVSMGGGLVARRGYQHFRMRDALNCGCDPPP